MPFNWPDLPPTDPAQQQSPTWSDYGNTLVSGAQGLDASVNAAGRYLADFIGSDNLSQYYGASEQLGNMDREESTRRLSDVARERLQSAVTSGDFWSHPFSAGALKATGMAPGVLAAAIPSTVLGGVVGTGALLGVGGAMLAGQGLDEFYQKVDAESDVSLQKQSDLYRGLRTTFGETEARRQYNLTLQGAKPALTFLIGAVTSVVGPAGMAGRIAGGGTGVIAHEGAALLTRMGMGAAEGAAGGAIQGGTADLAVQNALQQGGLQGDIDKEKLANAVLEPALFGAAAGTVGGIPKGKSAGKKSAENSDVIPADRAADAGGEPPPPPAPATNDETPSMPPKGAGTGNPPPPSENVNVGNPDSAPTRSEQRYPKADKAKRAGKDKEKDAGNDTPIAPDEAAALDAKQPQPVPTSGDVARSARTTPSIEPPPIEPGHVEQTPAPVNDAAVRAVSRPDGRPESTSDISTPIDLAGTPEKRPGGLPSGSPEDIPIRENAPQPREPRKSRVLPDLTQSPEEVRRYNEDASKQLAENAKEAREVIQRDGQPKEVVTDEKNPKRAAKRVSDNEVAKRIFDESVPEKTELPVAPTAREELRARLQKAIDDAEAAGVKVPAKVTDATPDHVAWLREAKDLATRLAKKGYATTAKGREHITTFLGRESAARGGDFSVMRGERKAEGEAARRQNQGDVEAIAAKPVAGGDIEKEAVQTVVPRSARGTPRGLDEGSTPEAPKASPVRKVELTPEQKAKALAAFDVAAKRAKARGEPEAAPAIHREKQPDSQKPTPREALTREAAGVDRNPSEAQKEAGNYAKGHVKIAGLDVTIENPRGSERSGKDQNGKPWSVKMPDHYGYIKRTEGADGDHVDVYLGPRAHEAEKHHVVVVDQVHPDTRAFDEHKVMLGYDNVRDAITAYDKAFSDGRGMERVGDVTPMTMDEFKEWLKKGDTKEAAGVSDKQIASALELRPGKIRTAGYERDPVTNAQVSRNLDADALHTMKARDVLKALDLSSLAGIPAKLAPFIQRRLSELAGDVDVHIVSKEEMARINSEPHNLGEHEGTLGKHVETYWNGGAHVLLRADVLKDPARTAHVVMHEVTHSATVRALMTDPKLAGDVARIAAEVKDILRGAPKDIRDKVAYGLLNPREFIAEAFSNPEFQDILSQIPLSAALVERLNLPHTNRLSAWDAVVHLVRNIVEKITGKFPQSYTALDGIMRVGEGLATRRAQQLTAERRAGGPIPWRPDPRAMAHGLVGDFKDPVTMAHDLRVDVHGKIERAIDSLDAERRAPWILKTRTFDNLAQAADRYYGRENNPVRKVADLLEMTRRSAQEYLQKSEPVVSKLYELEQKYRRAGRAETWQRFTEFAHDVTMAGVHPHVGLDHVLNEHLGKDALRGVWAKEQHADLAKAYRSLPEDLKQAYHDATAYFTEQQNAMSLGLIKNRILKVLGIEGTEAGTMAQRIHEGTTTEGDKTKLGDAYELVTEAKALAKLRGPYLPLMRRGDHVVLAKYKIEAPKVTSGVTHRQLDENTYEFAGAKASDVRKAAIDYAKQQSTHPDIKSLWVDKTTGETHVVDTDGKEIKVTPQDTNAEQRFQVSVQNRHVEFFPTKKEAFEAKARMEGRDNNPFEGDIAVEERRHEPGDLGGDLHSYQLRALMDSIKKRDNYRSMTEAQQHELVQALSDASLRFLGSTRIQSKRLPRRYVEGASKDLTRNALEYAQSSSAYLAKLEHAPQLEAAMKEVRDAVSNSYDKDRYGRSAIANEVERRVRYHDTYAENQWYAPITKRLATLSFLDKLFSPSYSVVNALQPAMVAMPVLAGRHGVGRAFTELSRAYKDISAQKVLKAGVVNTAKRAKSSTADVGDLIGDIKGRLTSAREREMIDYLAARGSIDPEAGMEIARFIRSRDGAAAKLDTGLGYLDSVARQAPRALEAINRTVTALAAYRLEMKRSGNHETAMRSAQEAVNNTQFLYSSTNSPTLFNHPLAKLSLQFKSYALGMYQLLGQHISRAFGDDKAARAESLRTLGYLAMTHMAAAGALGLPTEPIKLGLMGAQAFGLTSFGWGDVESAVRKGASNLVGNTAGELLTRGLPRVAGIDISSRVGLDTLMTFGEPKSNKDTDVKSWLFDTLAGAPVALVGDWVRGANALSAGNFTKAAELMIPIKMASDSIRAYRQATEGKKNQGERQTMTPYTPGEILTRVVGFTPAREAENSSARAQAYAVQGREKNDRQSLLTAWVTAKPSEKSNAWAAVQRFNTSRSADTKITMQQLTSAAKRRADEEDTVVRGIRTSKRDRALIEQSMQPYNQ